MVQDVICVLLVEDDEGDARLACKALATFSGLHFSVTRARCISEATELLQNRRFDVVLLDLGLPESDGLETLTSVRQASHDVPIVVLTGRSDQSASLLALEAGAQDYLPKTDMIPDTLARVIHYSIQRHRLVGELKLANELMASKNRRLAELYETAQQFVDNVSHEFRTPLTVIREFTSIVCDGLDGPVTEQQTKRLGAILNRTDDLALMVDDLLDISRLESGLLSAWRRRCDVADVLHQAASLIRRRAASKNVELEITLEESLPEIYCDDEKARRVLINLAINAIKFTPEGGRVELWARRRGDGQLAIGVTDNGPGISPADLAVIFDRFRQADTPLRSSTKGFGLGLNIAKDLVRLNLGTIDVASEVGEGSTFSFTIPLAQGDVLVERYIDHVMTFDREKHVSMLVAEIGASSQRNVTPVVDEFLQQSLRCHDLVYQVADRRWLLLALCSSVEVGDLVGRISNKWKEYDRNYPQADLPSLSLDVGGTWDVAISPDRIRAAFREAADCNMNASVTYKKVLVVDDDLDVAAGLSIRLQAAGYEIIGASDGQAGVDAAVAQHPDAILMDVRMPGMDGIAALQHLRSNVDTFDIPIIILSASLRDQQRALDEGANFFVQKPYDVDTVLSALKSSLAAVAV